MKFLIEGGNTLGGSIGVQGSKNSVLPILAATVLIDGESIIHNCPCLSDVDATVSILNSFGCTVKRENGTLIVNSQGINNCSISERLSHMMRSSILFLGPVAARFGRAEFSAPGGCEIGSRPVDLHLSSLKLLGAEITEQDGLITCEVKDGFKGKRIDLSFPSVGATENVILASVTAKGTTVLSNAAREPEIVDLAHFLNKAGAQIYGAGEKVVVIVGVPALNSVEHTVIPDRIVSATYLFCTAVTGGQTEITNAIPSHLETVFPLLETAGCVVKRNTDSIFLRAPKRLSCIKTVRTMPYPGFPTDLQSPITALLSVANGTSVVTETIFENRHKFINELLKLGANIRVEGRDAVIDGVEDLTGAEISATDLRGGFALVIAALKAHGSTVIDNIYHIDRGYEKPVEMLASLGANIKRIT